MSDYVLTCSSVADLPAAFTEEHHIGVLPYHLYIDGEEYLDMQGRPLPEDANSQSITNKDFYNKMREGASPSTSMVNFERYMQFFRPYLEAGKDVLHLEFSSSLSGTYANAVRAARDLKKEFPDRTVKIADTLSASVGYGLLVVLTEEQKENGATLDEAYDFVEKTRLLIPHWFAVEDLEYLRRGGRLSRASAAVGSMLNLKPTLALNNEGKVVPVEKVRGRRKSIQSLFGKIGKEIADSGKDQRVIVAHSDAAEEAEKLAEQVREAFPQAKEVDIWEMGPIIGAHLGPGGIGVTYLGSGRPDIEAK